MTSILNRYFDPMIELIRSYGGIIGKFGGDAMTVLFPYSQMEARDVALRSIQCALDMQAKMVNYQDISTSGGTYELTMKAGLAAGPLFLTTIGDPAIRLEYIVAGQALDYCAEAEHLASRGQVVVHVGLQELAGLTTEKLNKEYGLLKDKDVWRGELPRREVVTVSQDGERTIAAFCILRLRSVFRRD
ncbi:MAG: adenylate/guanylate cyclase domain-containing protein [Anaerolineae bacterium]|nr:adenylate/guanylate cyclase domain-containing protein [Anaerolineae bacterium]